MLDAVAERKEIRKPAKHYEEGGGGGVETRGEKEREGEGDRHETNSERRHLTRLKKKERDKKKGAIKEKQCSEYQMERSKCNFYQFGSALFKNCNTCMKC